MWEACVLLVLHGCAAALWAPAEQLLLPDFAEPADLPGAVLNATFRNLGILAGPAVGSALLPGLGAEPGIFADVLFYLPTGLIRPAVAVGGVVLVAGTFVVALVIALRRRAAAPVG